MGDERQRLAEAMGELDPAAAVLEFARRLRDEGMDQVTMFRLFSEQQRLLSGDDPRYDALVDTMDLIWGGPWAKGGALFDEELTNDRLGKQ
jgi:hypothetical protein